MCCLYAQEQCFTDSSERKFSLFSFLITKEEGKVFYIHGSLSLILLKTGNSYTTSCFPVEQTAIELSKYHTSAVTDKHKQLNLSDTIIFVLCKAIVLLNCNFTTWSWSLASQLLQRANFSKAIRSFVYSAKTLLLTLYRKQNCCLSPL